MVTATQSDNPWIWFRRIMQKGYSSGICRRFGSFIGSIILISGLVVAFHLSCTAFSLSMTVIISGVTFFLIRELMAVYERYWWTEEMTTIQLGELSGCFINQDQTDALVTQKSTDRSTA